MQFNSPCCVATIHSSFPALRLYSFLMHTYEIYSESKHVSCMVSKNPRYVREILGGKGVWQQIYFLTKYTCARDRVFWRRLNADTSDLKILREILFQRLVFWMIICIFPTLRNKCLKVDTVFFVYRIEIRSDWVIENLDKLISFAF